MAQGVDVVFDSIDDVGVTGAGTIGDSSAEQLAGKTEKVLTSGITIKADGGNTDAIYVGFSNGVTSSTGYKLAAGDERPIPIRDMTKVWIIGGAAGQAYSWLGI